MNAFQKRHNDFVNRMFTRNVLGVITKPCPTCGKKKEINLKEILDKANKEHLSSKNTD